MPTQKIACPMCFYEGRPDAAMVPDDQGGVSCESSKCEFASPPDETERVARDRAFQATRKQPTLGVQPSA